MPDKLIWKLEKKGFYSVKSAYWIARDIVLDNILASSSLGDPYNSLWKALWNSKIPGKVKKILWRASHNLLPTRDCLSLKGYEGDMGCLLCDHRFESIGHVFCGCPVAQSILAAPPFNLQVILLHFSILRNGCLSKLLH